jgi:hypothetical protein
MRAIASITPSEPTLAARPRLAQSGPQSEAPAKPAQLGRALVLVGSGPATAVDPAGSRPLAAFLAQLIATAQQAPQTRRRRRAEPKEASAIYAAVSASGGPHGARAPPLRVTIGSRSEPASSERGSPSL